MDYIFRWERRDLGVGPNEKVGEDLDEVFPLFFRQAVHGL